MSFPSAKKTKNLRVGSKSFSRIEIMRAKVRKLSLSMKFFAVSALFHLSELKKENVIFSLSFKEATNFKFILCYITYKLIKGIITLYYY